MLRRVTLSGIAVLFGLLPLPILAIDDAQFIQVLEPFIAQHAGNRCQVYSMTCQTNNPGAVTCASGGRPTCYPDVARFQGRPCGRPNDTACFETDDRGIGAMTYNFLKKVRAGCTSIYSVLEGCVTVSGGRVRGYSSSADGNNSRSYATQIGQWTGINPDTALDPNNAINIGKIMVAMARVESGRGGLKFNAQQLRQGLAYAYGTTALPDPTPGWVPHPGPVINPGDLTRGPGVLTPGSIISPFSGQVLPPLSALGAAPGSVATPTNVPPGQPLSEQVLNGSGQGTNTTTSFVSGGASAGMIIAQPQFVTRGGTVLIAWSSVNMKPSSCQVTKNGTQISTNTEGSQIYTITEQATFVLRCTDAQGNDFERTAIANIQ